MNASSLRVSSRVIAFASALALGACGGGGGSSSIPVTGGGGGATPSPTAPPTSTPGYARPSFFITVPASGSSTGGKKPAFVSSATQSITVRLISDQQGIDPNAVPGNPASTDISGASCSSGCTVQGPLSPIGDNGYTITTNSGTGGSGSALATWTGSFTIAQGVSNAETLTLQGIPAIITLAALPTTYQAGTTNGAQLGITIKDAGGQVITGTYATPVTVSDPDTNGDGTHVSANTCGSIYPGGNITVSTTSVVLAQNGDAAYFCYGGLAENQVTVTAAAGAANATANFFPVLNAPVYVNGSGTPSGIVTGTNPPSIDLFATSGLGSTGSATFTESGWTDAPYDQTLFAAGNGVCSVGGPFFIYATAAPAYDVTGTIVTVTALASGPTVGACPVPISDHVNVNPHPTSAVLNTSYTTTGFGINSTLRNR